LISLYARIRKGGRILEDKKSSLQNQLRLSGLVKSDGGYLTVNNKIYHEAFNLEWIKENTEINWTLIIATITTIIALFFAGASLYDSVIIPSQFDRADDCFKDLSNPPELRLSCLATMFRLDPFFGIGDNEDTAREAFFNLPTWEYQRSIFQAQNVDNRDLIEVTRGLYYALADTHQPAANTALLEIMQAALVKVKNAPEAEKLEQELLAWSSARKDLELLKQDEDHATILRSYDQVIGINPENPSTLFERGLVRFNGGDFAGALQSFDETIAVSKKSAPTKGQTETPTVAPEPFTAAPTNATVPTTETEIFSTPQPTAPPSDPPPSEPPSVLGSIKSEFYTHTKRVIVIRDFIDNHRELLTVLQNSSTNEYVNLRATPEIVSLLTANLLTLDVTSSPQTYGQVGESIFYTYVITNTAAMPLGPAQFTINDDRLGASMNCGPSDTTIRPGQSLTCAVPYTITQLDMTQPNLMNSATASGDGQTSAIATITITNLTLLSSNVMLPGSTIQHQAAEGEWLGQIAHCYGADLNAVQEANPRINDVMTNIPPGTLIVVPDLGSVGTIYGPPCITFYTVQTDDTWASIAQRFNADVAILQIMNPVAISVGTVLKIPLNSAGTRGVTALPETLVPLPTTVGGATTPTPIPKPPFSATVTQVESTITHPELACNWAGIGGTVVDANDSHVIGAIVVLRGTFNGNTIEQQSVSGINKEYGPSGFEFVLGSAPVESNETLLVQLVDQLNIPLSDPVQISTSTDCSKNLVLIRFKRNR
jgi:hypothetical protein